MIFVGDIALPHKGAIQYKDFPKNLALKNWFGNLEGAIVNDDDNMQDAIYNNEGAIEEIISNFNFKGFSLANNHIFDTGSLENTVDYFIKKKILCGGIGSNIDQANKELILEENGVQIVIINFGWEVIQCEITTSEVLGVNPLRRGHVIKTVKDLVSKYPKAKIIPFMHWSYELEAEPQPFERELAKKLIDIGAAGVMGCHSHRVGGFEIYRGKPILYSLGNWLFKQNHYFGGKHKFPDFCNLQLAFEWDFSNEVFQFHFFNYDVEQSKLDYLKSEARDSELMRKNTPFLEYSNLEYKKWYRKNHFHKNKGLPIYYWEDSNFKIVIKNKINKLRDRVIYIITKVI